jgi:recombination associated protein RdgC
MKLISNAIIYAAELPPIDAMVEHVQELPFAPIGPVFTSRAGFVQNLTTGEWVTPFEGGYSFTVRLDEKLLPKASVRRAMRAAVDAYCESEGLEDQSHLPEGMAAMIEEKAYAALVANALEKSTFINGFYSEDHQYLFLPTTQKDLANTVMSMLIKVCGSVKTSTIHVADIKGGLTARLKRLLGFEMEEADEAAFEGFEVGESVKLKDGENQVTFNLGDINTAHAGLLECFEQKMKVEIMELIHNGVHFKLTHDFKLKGLSFEGELTQDEQDAREEAGDMAMLWRIEAATQVLHLVNLVNTLCALFSYQRPELIEVKAEDARMSEAVPVSETEVDPLYAEAVLFVRDEPQAVGFTVSTIQHRFRVGYNRAIRLVDALERNKVITGDDGMSGLRHAIVEIL